MKRLKPKKENNNINIGIKLASDIVASGIVGTVLGISLDKIFGTSPILLIICLILSLISLFKQLYKYLK